MGDSGNWILVVFLEGAVGQKMLNKLEDAKFITMHDDLFEAGRDEDGEVVHGNIYFILAETPDGFRFQLDRRFVNEPRTEYADDDSGCWRYVTNTTVGPRAEALMNRIQAHVDGGGKLDPIHWAPTQGCYGTLGRDEAEELALEIQEAHEAGESVPSRLLALAFA